MYDANAWKHYDYINFFSMDKKLKRLIRHQKPVTQAIIRKEVSQTEESMRVLEYYIKGGAYPYFPESPKTDTFRHITREALIRMQQTIVHLKKKRQLLKLRIKD